MSNNNTKHKKMLSNVLFWVYITMIWWTDIEQVYALAFLKASHNLGITLLKKICKVNIFQEWLCWLVHQKQQIRKFKLQREYWFWNTGIKRENVVQCSSKKVKTEVSLHLPEENSKSLLVQIHLVFPTSHSQVFQNGYVSAANPPHSACSTQSSKWHLYVYT